jgi:L-amino acid N-acyltransferase YncA
MELTVRAAQHEDAAAWAEIYNQGIEDRQATFETKPRTGADLMKQIERTIVAERDGRVVGWAGIVPYSPREVYASVAEFSIYVERSARGSGVGTRLLTHLAVFAESHGYHKLTSKIFPENEASLALMRSCGFRDVGIHKRHALLDGAWRDVVVVERLLGAAAR